MNLRNTFFVALVVGLAMFLTQVVRAQPPNLESLYHIPYQETQEAFENQAQSLVNYFYQWLLITAQGGFYTNVKDLDPETQFNDSGALSWWDVGRVYESTGAQRLTGMCGGPVAIIGLRVRQRM